MEYPHVYRKYIFNPGPFSIAMLVYQSVSPKLTFDTPFETPDPLNDTQKKQLGNLTSQEFLRAKTSIQSTSQPTAP